MNSGTAWTIAAAGCPGKPQAGCAVLPAFQPSRTMSDLAIWPFLPTSRHTPSVVMTRPSLELLRWAGLGRSPSISRSNREHRHTRAVIVEQTVKFPRRRVAYPALRLAHRSTPSPCCGDPAGGDGDPVARPRQLRRQPNSQKEHRPRRGLPLGHDRARRSAATRQGIKTTRNLRARTRRRPLTMLRRLRPQL